MKTNLCILFAVLLLSSCNKKENFYVDFLEAEQSEMKMMVGEETTLRVAKFYPQEPTEYELRWRSNDSYLIDLDSISGKVTAKMPGDAYVQIYCNDMHKGNCKIRIEGVFDAKNDVYICGNNGGRSLPVYWKNGFMHTLNTTKEYTYVIPSDIDVYNGDVYVVGSATGHVNGSYLNEVICWKNGEQIFSSNQGSSTSYKLFVDNNDYYILGFIADPAQKPTIWKNGERTDFLLENRTYARSIFVSNNDVYVAGETTYDLKPTSETSVLDCTMAKYWKNGQETCLTDSNSVAGAYGITVVGQDVYVVGWKLENGTMVAKYWKNSEEFNLNDNNEWSVAQSIAINGNDVYISGVQKNNDSYIPVYWKNGIKTQLENNGDYYMNSNIEVAKSGDVYLATEYGCYFKNGEKIYFSRDYTDVGSIKIVSK